MTFPVEILEHIFIYIDPVTLTKLRTICTFWKEIIDKILQDYDLWYTKCKEDIPEDIWYSLLDLLYPSRSYIDLMDAKEDVEIWMNMYKWWTKLKNLTKCNISVECLDPIPKHRFRENITCTAVIENIVAIGTSEGYIYFYDINTLDKPIYVADHMEFVCNVKFLKNDRKFIAVSSCTNNHVKFWNLKSKELVNKDRGKLLCTSPMYCYTAIREMIIIQGCKSRMVFECPANIIAGTADGTEVYFYTEDGHIMKAYWGLDYHDFFDEFIEPPEFVIRHYYVFKTRIVVCITEHGHLGFSIQGEKWKFHNVLPILHGIPTAVLIYVNLLILGLDSGHICIYYVEDFNTLDMTNTVLTKRVILDTEPIISLDINAYLKQYIIAASSKRVHFINFI